MSSIFFARASNRFFIYGILVILSCMTVSLLAETVDIALRSSA
jgi:hypothetical protein